MYLRKLRTWLGAEAEGDWAQLFPCRESIKLRNRRSRKFKFKCKRSHDDNIAPMVRLSPRMLDFSVPRTQVRTSARSPPTQAVPRWPRENLELIISIQNQTQRQVFLLP